MKLTPVTQRVIDRFVADHKLDRIDTDIFNRIIELVYINGMSDGSERALDGYKKFLAEEESE